MNKTLTISLIIFLAYFVNAQRGWQKISSSVYGNGSTSLYFVDSLTGFVNCNGFQKTTDGGYTWNSISISAFSGQVIEIKFMDTQLGFATCSEGSILKTTDRGNTWKKISTGRTSKMVGLAFTSDRKIFIGGGTEILRSTDLGESWAIFTAPLNNLKAMAFLNNLVGYAGGRSTTNCVKTTDGGLNWSTTNSIIPYADVNKLVFVDSLTGYAVTELALAKTSDGGKTWTNIYYVPIASSFSSITTWREKNAWVAGYQSGIYHSNDAGLTWIKQSFPSTTDFIEGIFFTDTLQGWLLTWDGLYKTSNGGFLYPAPIPPWRYSPSNNEVNVSVNPVLVWAQPTNTVVSSYHLQVAKDAAFSSLIFNDSTLTDTIKQIMGLNYNTKYYWRVSAKSPDIAGEYTDATMFITGHDTSLAIPNAPALIYPAMNDTGLGISLIFQWAKPQNVSVDTYDFQIATDSLFASVIFNDSTLTDTVKSITSLSYLQKYFWRVRAQNNGGISSFSPTGVFTTGVKQILYSDPTFFPLQIGNSWYYEGLDTAWNTAGKYYQVIKTILDSTSNNTHQVEVKKIYVDSVATSYETWQYYDGAFSVGDDQLYLNYLMKDTAVGLTSYYSHALGKDTVLARVYEIQTYGHSETVHGQGYSKTFKTAKYMGPYYYSFSANGWRTPLFTQTIYSLIGAKFGNTLVGDSIQLRIPSVPILVYPGNNETNVVRTALFSWRDPQGNKALTYRIQVASDSNFTTIVFDTSNTQLTTKQIRGLTGGTKYYWRVKSRNYLGESSYAKGQAFTTSETIISAPNCLSLRNTYTDTAAVFVWSKPAKESITSYRVQLAKEYNFTNIVIDTLVKDTSSVIALMPWSSYYWRVCGVNNAGNGPYSTAYPVWTYNRLYIAPTLNNPPMNGRISNQWATFKWLNTHEGTYQYNFQVATDDAFSKVVFDYLKVPDTIFVLNSLRSGLRYYWRVRAINDVAVGPYSDVFSFTTLSVALTVSPALAPTSVGGSPGENSVTCRWYQLPGIGGVSYQVQIALDSSFVAPLVFDTTMTDTSFVINRLQSGTTYYWRVRAMNAENVGPFSSSKSFTTEGTKPVFSLRLDQNYPNPFNPSTTIKYEVPETGRVSMRLFSVLGNELATLLDEDKLAGNYTLKINLANLPSGVYIYKLQQGGNVQSKKLMLLK